MAVYRLHDENYTTRNLDKFINELSFWLKFNSDIFQKNIFPCSAKDII